VPLEDCTEPTHPASAVVANTIRRTAKSRARKEGIDFSKGCPLKLSRVRHARLEQATYSEYPRELLQ
jgi:hypothetical protein